MSDLRIHNKHPTLDAYFFQGAYVPYAIIAQEKRFTDAELAAEHYAALVDIDIELRYFHRDSQELKERFSTVARFATLPHYDEQ